MPGLPTGHPPLGTPAGPPHDPEPCLRPGCPDLLPAGPPPVAPGVSASEVPSHSPGGQDRVAPVSAPEQPLWAPWAGARDKVEGGRLTAGAAGPRQQEGRGPHTRRETGPHDCRTAASSIFLEAALSRVSLVFSTVFCPYSHLLTGLV